MIGVHRCAVVTSARVAVDEQIPAAVGANVAHGHRVERLADGWLADFPAEPCSQIKGFGNRIRHEYFRLDDALLWEIMTTDADALKTVMETMLARHTRG